MGNSGQGGCMGWPIESAMINCCVPRTRNIRMQNQQLSCPAPVMPVEELLKKRLQRNVVEEPCDHNVLFGRGPVAPSEARPDGEFLDHDVNAHRDQDDGNENEKADSHAAPNLPQVGHCLEFAMHQRAGTGAFRCEYTRQQNDGEHAQEA